MNENIMFDKLVWDETQTHLQLAYHKQASGEQYNEKGKIYKNEEIFWTSQRFMAVFRAKICNEKYFFSWLSFQQAMRDSGNVFKFACCYKYLNVILRCELLKMSHQRKGKWTESWSFKFLKCPHVVWKKVVEWKTFSFTFTSVFSSAFNALFFVNH